MTNGPMNKDLKVEIERKNFIRAVQIAKSLGLTEEKIKDLQLQALWQMAVLNRNAAGLKILAQEYNVQKGELKKYLEDRSYRERENRKTKALSVCFDLTTRKYLNFQEWLDYYTKKWKDYSINLYHETSHI